MKVATSLTVIAVGAILAFAVTTTPGFLNIQIVGWIFMITGALGLALARTNREWLRRTVIVRGSPEVSRTSQRRRSTANRRQRPPRQLVAAAPRQAAQAAPSAETPAPAAPVSPSAPTEEFEPVTIEEFTEQ